MKNVIITGTNGMIGGLVLSECLNRKDVNSVTSVTRKKTGIIHSKLREVIHNDFLNFSLISDEFRNMDICFYCLGVYTGQVNRQEFYRITVDITKAFAEELRHNNDKTIFCFLSGQGADSKERSKIMFARDKGIAENILIRLNFFRTYIFRPGYIYPVVPRKEPNILYKVMRVLYRTFSGLFPGMGTTSEQLASTMVDVAFNGGDKTYYENRDIRKYRKTEVGSRK